MVVTSERLPKDFAPVMRVRELPGATNKGGSKISALATYRSSSTDASQKIDKQAASLSGWQAEMYSRLRELINVAHPGLDEDWKWETAVWTHKGNVCALGVFK